MELTKAAVGLPSRCFSSRGVTRILHWGGGHWLLSTWSSVRGSGLPDLQPCLGPSAPCSMRRRSRMASLQGIHRVLLRRTCLRQSCMAHGVCMVRLGTCWARREFRGLQEIPAGREVGQFSHHIESPSDHTRPHGTCRRTVAPRPAQGPSPEEERRHLQASSAYRCIPGLRRRAAARGDMIDTGTASHRFRQVWTRKKIACLKNSAHGKIKV